MHDAVNEEHKDYNKHAAAVWSAAEVHDVKTEQLFRYLQVFHLKKRFLVLCIIRSAIAVVELVFNETMFFVPRGASMTWLYTQGAWTNA